MNADSDPWSCQDSDAIEARLSIDTTGQRLSSALQPTNSIPDHALVPSVGTRFGGSADKHKAHFSANPKASFQLTPLGGGAGNRTLVQRHKRKASPGAVVVSAFSAFLLSHDSAGNAAQSLLDVPSASDNRSGW